MGSLKILLELRKAGHRKRVQRLMQ